MKRWINTTEQVNYIGSGKHWSFWTKWTFDSSGVMMDFSLSDYKLAFAHAHLGAFRSKGTIFLWHERALLNMYSYKSQDSCENGYSFFWFEYVHLEIEIIFTKNWTSVTKTALDTLRWWGYTERGTYFWLNLPYLLIVPFCMMQPPRVHAELVYALQGVRRKIRHIDFCIHF